MMELNRCPSLLTEGFSTYSPQAAKLLFDGVKVSHVFNGINPLFPEPSKEAIQNVGRISLSGAQPKFSIIQDGGKLRYTREDERGTYILKPAPNAMHILEKDECVANEHLTMQLASQIYGIETAPNGICFFEDGTKAYFTRRFDVVGSDKLLQEDFASLLGVSKATHGTDYKYTAASYEDCADIIKKYVKAYKLDLLRFFRLILFNFLVLNDDAHLKNFSLIKIGDEYRLSPAYDLVNTSLHIWEPSIFALSKGLFKEGMHFSDTHSISRAHFEEFGRRIGLSEKIIQQEIEKFASPNPQADDLIRRSFLSPKNQKNYLDSYNYRKVLLRY